MSLLRLSRRQGPGLFVDVRTRLGDLKPSKPGVIRALRGGIRKQFDQQVEHTPRGARPWVQSVRASVHPDQGGTPLTLVDTGAYRTAWMRSGRFEATGKGGSFKIEISPVKYPQVDIFQASGNSGVVVPRRLGVSQGTVREARTAILSWALRGKRR